jgi:DnaJ-domain-containing protein 1
MFLIYFLIGIGLMVLVYMGAKAFAQARPAQLVTGLRVAGGIGAALAGIWLLLTGRINLAIMLASVFAPVLARWRAGWRAGRAGGGPAAGQSSQVETAWLRMHLDHDTGILDGTVLQGRFGGRRLGEMSIPELAALLARLRVNDPDSATVLETYLDRARPEWREGAGEAAADEAPPAASGAGPMTREEAYRILGLEPGAPEKAIRDAHRKLMMKVHPDQGGSTYLAAKINQAKDLLLKD